MKPRQWSGKFLVGENYPVLDVPYLDDNSINGFKNSRFKKKKKKKQRNVKAFFGRETKCFCVHIEEYSQYSSVCLYPAAA